MTSSNIDVCRLCLKVHHNFDSIESTVQDSLKTLSLSVDLKATREAVICKDCTTNVKKCLIYKSASLNLRNTFQNAKDAINDMCLFCTRQMDISSLVCLSSKGANVVLLKMTMEQCFPELDIQTNADSILICIWCAKNIQKNFEFIVNCLKVEQQIKEYKKQFEGELNLKNIVHIDKDIKTDEILNTRIVVKKENEEHDSSNSYIKPENIKSELYDDFDLNLNSGLVKNEMWLENEAVQVKCENEQDAIGETLDCEDENENSVSDDIVESTGKGDDSYQITIYECDKCIFQTLYKASFNQHKTIHMSSEEIVMCTCDICGFKTKSEVYLRKHKLVHKNNHEVTMHKCEICDYVSRYKDSVRVHKLRKHQKSEEVATYSCYTCGYKVKVKADLIDHMLIHRSSERQMIYKCGFCGFETKYKRYLRRHLRKIHKYV